MSSHRRRRRKHSPMNRSPGTLKPIVSSADHPYRLTLSPRHSLKPTRHKKVCSFGVSGPPLFAIGFIVNDTLVKVEFLGISEHQDRAEESCAAPRLKVDD